MLQAQRTTSQPGQHREEGEKRRDERWRGEGVETRVISSNQSVHGWIGCSFPRRQYLLTSVRITTSVFLKFTTSGS